MSESSALQWLRAPKLAEDALPTDSLIVECRRCGRSVPVSMSPLRPPGFLHVEDQVECPEVQERWTGRGEGGLLLMMCGSLEHSLDAGWADEADAHRDSIVASEPSLHARPAPEQVDVSPETWHAHRQDDIDDAGEPGGLQSPSARPWRRWLAHIGTAVGFIIMVGIGAGSALLLLREPRVSLQTAPVSGANAPRSPVFSTLPSGRQTMLGVAAAAPPAAQESAVSTRSLSPSAAMLRPPLQRQACRHAQGPVSLFVRPENVSLVMTGPGANRFECTVVGQRFHHAAKVAVAHRRRQVLRDHAERRAIPLGEHHVEGDHPRAGLRQLVHQFGNQVARPRPLAEFPK